MRILILEKPSDKLRGKLTRYMYEVSPNRFVGNISKRIADSIWDTIKEDANEQTKATFVEPCDNEQGFCVRNIGYPTYSCMDFDEVNLFSRKPNVVEQLAFRSISKTSGKSIVAHLIDVASVCEVLVNKGYFKNIASRFCKKAGVSEKDFKSYVTWCCAFHDIGKLHPDFQQNILENASYDEKGAYECMIQEHNLLNKSYEKCRHEVVSSHFLKQHFVKNNLYCDNSNPRRSKIEPHLEDALQIVGMHHQGKDKNYAKKENPLWEEARMFVYEKLSSIYPYKKVEFPREYRYAAFLLALSIVNTSDFIGSKEDFFSFNVNLPGEIDTYRTKVKENAYNVLEKSGLLYHEGDSLNFEALFPNIKEKRPMQLEALESFDFVKNNARFVIVEDVCGSGKTESGLSLCNAMSNSSHGLYAALPTHATSSAMLPRVRDYIEAIGSPYKPELFTSKARYVENEPSLEQDEMDAWLNNNYHKMSYPYGVGTIDQLLRGVRKEKYGLIRLFGVLSKTVLLDEIHSYDSYMLRIIEMFLSYCNIFDTPVVMMSASLDKDTKKRLVKAISGLDYEPLDGYPLVTYGTNNEIIQKKIECWHEPYERRYKMLPFLNDVGKIASHVCELSSQYGGCIGVVCNLVNDSILVYKKLKETLPKDVELILYHSKFYDSEKEAKTQEIIKKLGKNREHRPSKCVVVSTQILEQSIDIDFDILCTEISPIDSLIQRMGRLWRHSSKGTIRECTKIDTPLFVYSSKDDDYGKHSKFVYKGNVLKETNDVLCEKSSICIPNDIRKIVDKVYASTIVENKGNYADQGNVSPYAPLANDKISWVKESNVRYQEYEAVNLAIVTSSQMKALENNDYPTKLCEDIAKNQALSSIPLYQIDGEVMSKQGKKLLKNYLMICIEDKSPCDFSQELEKHTLTYNSEFGFESYKK